MKFKRGLNPLLKPLWFKLLLLKPPRGHSVIPYVVDCQPSSRAESPPRIVDFNELENGTPYLVNCIINETDKNIHIQCTEISAGQLDHLHKIDEHPVTPSQVETMKCTIDEETVKCTIDEETHCQKIMMTIPGRTLKTRSMIDISSRTTKWRCSARFASRRIT